MTIFFNNKNKNRKKIIYIYVCIRARAIIYYYYCYFYRVCFVYTFVGVFPLFNQIFFISDAPLHVV